MKLTQKIQMEIYSHKLADFYMALFACKVQGNPDENTMRKIVDAINFDKD